MKTNRRNIIIAAAVALLFLFVTYIVMNCRWSVSGEKFTLKYVDLALTKLRGYEKNIDMSDSMLLIDVHYDKQLVVAHDKSGQGIGLSSVTDRTKLFELLSKLKQEDNYKYIMLDVAFCLEDRQSQDSSLYKLISSMKCITIPMPMGDDIADVSLVDSGKVGMAQYGTTIWETDFVKYPYYTKGKKSMPMLMYEEQNKSSVIHSFWLFHSEGKRLIRNSVIQMLDFRTTSIDEVLNGAPPINVPYDMGVGILGIYPDGTVHDSYSDNADWAKDKYILIGDFEGDTHTTYRGEIPGTVINFNAYLSLLEGQHIISYTFLVLLLLYFYLQSYLIITRQDLYTITKKYLKNKNLHVGYFRKTILRLAKTCSVLGYPVLSAMICVLSFYLFNEVFDILLTISLFYALKRVVNVIHKFKLLKYKQDI